MMTALTSFSPREHAARHPMAVFALAAGIALASIGVFGEASRHVGVPAATGGMESPKTDRLRAPTETEIACAGQAWGSEDGKCLIAILKEGGKSSSARIRTISGA